MSLLFSMLASAVAAPAPPADPLVTDFHIERLELLKDGSLPSAGMWLWKWKDWIKVEQLPAAIRDKPSKRRATLRMSIDRDGHLKGCDTIGTENVDVGKAACRAISGNPSFPITYAAPGQPIPDQWTMALVWETLTTSDFATAKEARRHIPRPPPPPLLNAGTWPPLYPPHALVIATLPEIATVAPRSGRGTVGVNAKPVMNREQPDCEIGRSSGKPELDEAACRYVRALRLRYKEPCFDCSSWWTYPLLIEFDGPRSQVRLPRDDLGFDARRPKLIGLEASKGDIAALRKLQLTRSRVTIVGTVGSDGSLVECRVSPTAGSPEADDALCSLMRRQRFTPALDAFGDPMTARYFQGLDLSRM